MSNFVQKQVVRLEVKVTDIGGAAVNADGFTLKLKHPNGTVTTQTPIVNPATGTYYHDFVLSVTGSYRFSGESSGAQQGYTEGSFFVFPATL